MKSQGKFCRSRSSAVWLLILSLVCPLLLSGCGKDKEEAFAFSERAETALLTGNDFVLFGSPEPMSWDNFLYYTVERRESEEGSRLTISGVTTAETGNLRVDGTLYLGPEAGFMDLDEEGDSDSLASILEGRLTALDESSSMTTREGAGGEWKHGYATGTENNKKVWSMSALARSDDDTVCVVMWDVVPAEESEDDGSSAVQTVADSLLGWFEEKLSLSRDSRTDSKAGVAGNVYWLGCGNRQLAGPELFAMSSTDFTLTFSRIDADSASLSLVGTYTENEESFDVDFTLTLNAETGKSDSSDTWTVESSVSDGVLTMNATTAGARAVVTVAAFSETATEADYDGIIEKLNTFWDGCSIQSRKET